MKVLCVFGRHQYGDQGRGEGTEYCAFIPALRALGHEVIHFDSWARAKNDYAALNRDLLETVERERPRVVLIVHLLFEIWTETLDILRNRGDVATVSWSTDDSWKYRKFSRFVGPHYHAMTTTYPYIVPRYKSDGMTNVLLTQWAASDDALIAPIPARSCEYQVSFVGAAHGDRLRWVQELEQAGIPVKCFGYGWPSGSVAATSISHVMNKSIISLNFANSSGENQIKARVFEVCGAGGFLLTETALGLENFYDIGGEIDTFRDMNEAVQKIRQYLEDEDLRDSMAQKAFERTRQAHTYIRRMEEVLDFACRSKAMTKEETISVETIWVDILKRHELTTILRLIRWLLTRPLALLLGQEKARRVARRLVYEISWRISGRHTFSASGLPGRMFPGA